MTLHNNSPTCGATSNINTHVPPSLDYELDEDTKSESDLMSLPQDINSVSQAKVFMTILLRHRYLCVVDVEVCYHNAGGHVPMLIM